LVHRKLALCSFFLSLLQTMLEGIRFKTTWETNDMVEFHLKAMEQQLKQMRHALKLAVLLNRTIIMPKVERAGSGARAGGR
jgi:hypothetical protein